MIQERIEISTYMCVWYMGPRIKKSKSFTVTLTLTIATWIHYVLNCQASCRFHSFGSCDDDVVGSCDYLDDAPKYVFHRQMFESFPVYNYLLYYNFPDILDAWCPSKKIHNIISWFDWCSYALAPKISLCELQEGSLHMVV